MSNPCDSCDKVVLANVIHRTQRKRFCFECEHGYAGGEFVALAPALAANPGVRSCRRRVTMGVTVTHAHSDAAGMA
ncbi:hypothetical protein AYO38_12120 [bacterium SCGC AG-212-C10]|nr:hypothetical protein AYO38_12120 [bacterium SCGC AG-212-C10]